MRSTRWTFGGYASTKAATLLSTVVLARLLPVADFGEMALATTIIGIFLTFNDLGVGNSLITGRDLTDRQEGAIFGVFLYMGPVMGVLTLLAGGLLFVAGDRVVGELLAAFSGLMAFSGLSWFLTVLLRKRLQFRGQFWSQGWQGVATLAAGVVSAILGAGVWSLFIGQAAGVLALTVVQLVVVAGLPRPVFSGPLLGEAVRGGRAFFAQGGLGYIAQNIDNLSVGAVLGTYPLALYANAYKLAELPYAAIGVPIYTVTFPTFARDLAAGQQVEEPFLNSLKLLSMVSSPFAAILIGASPALVIVMYGPHWAPAAPLLCLLGCWGMVRPLQAAIGWLFNSLGLAGLMARLAAVTLLVTAPSVFAAATFLGTRAVAAVMTGDIVVSFLAFSWIAVQRTDLTLKHLSETLLAPVGLAASAAGAIRLICIDAASLSPLVRLLISVIPCLVLYGVVLSLIDRHARALFLNAVRSLRSGPGGGLPALSA